MVNFAISRNINGRIYKFDLTPGETGEVQKKLYRETVLQYAAEYIRNELQSAINYKNLGQFFQSLLVELIAENEMAKDKMTSDQYVLSEEEKESIETVVEQIIDDFAS